MAQRKINIGDRFGKWTVIEEQKIVHYKSKKGEKWYKYLFKCRCDCGKVQINQRRVLVGNLSKSCKSCASKGKIRFSTHLKSKTFEYSCWHGMKQRCRSKNNPAYPYYGAKGIDVCDRWFDSFELFFEDMGLAPSNKHSLDRYPNKNGDYEPGNVRWATKIEQSNNINTNVLIEIGGVFQTLPAWCRDMNLPLKIISQRVHRNGWDRKTAILTPIKKINRNQ